MENLCVSFFFSSVTSFFPRLCWGRLFVFATPTHTCYTSYPSNRSVLSVGVHVSACMCCVVYCLTSWLSTLSVIFACVKNYHIGRTCVHIHVDCIVLCLISSYSVVIHLFVNYVCMAPFVDDVRMSCVQTM